MEEKQKQFNLIERLIEEKCRELESKEKELALREKVLKQCCEEFELNVGKFKELEAKEKEYRICESKQMEFEEFRKGVELKDEEIREKLHQVELKEKELEEKFKELELKKRSYANEIQMDGKSLQMYLNQCYKDNNFLQEEVASALTVSLDPAKLVLEAMQGFYPPHLKKGDSEFEGNVARSSFIFLLEQLLKLSPEINHQVEREAVKLAFLWILKMKRDPRQYLEVLGFLLLVASYGLVSSFDTDELCDYLLSVMTYIQAPELLRRLGLTNRIADFIKSLIRSKQHLEAVRFIYAFELVEEISPISILMEFMDYSEIRAGRSTSIPYTRENNDIHYWIDVSAETTSDEMTNSTLENFPSVQLPYQQPASANQDYIQNLIGRGHYLEAIKYIFSMDMIDEFQPLPLLETYLQSTENKEIYMQIEDIDKEIGDLRAVNACFIDHDLDSLFSPTLLVDRILQLKEEKREIQQERDSSNEASLSPINPETQPQQGYGKKRRRISFLIDNFKLLSC